MNRFLLFLGALCLLSSCSKSESGSSPYGLSTISIADAEFIYKRASTSRAGSDDEGYWKIDHQGNESKIIMYDLDGNPTNVQINEIKRLSDNLLFVETDVFFKMIADLNTEKLYQAPDPFGQTSAKEGADGNIYYTWNELFRINTTNFTVEPALPDGQYCTQFLVAKNGAIYYTGHDDLIWHNGGKIQMPGGRIYPIDRKDGVFLMNGELYALTLDMNNGCDLLDIYKWNMPSENELVEEHVCQGELPYGSTKIEAILQNETNGNLVFFTSPNNNYTIAEFDGTKFTTIKSYGSDKYAASFWDMLTQWYYNDGSSTNPPTSLTPGYLCFSLNYIVSLDLENYTFQGTRFQFNENEYDLYEVTSDPVNNRLLFTALRYLDGKVVIGEVSADGQISIINEKESSNRVVNLIPLN